MLVIGATVVTILTLASELSTDREAVPAHPAATIVATMGRMETERSLMVS
jgi:hypothetical protein